MSGPRGPAIEAPEIHLDAEHPHEEFFAPWREARALRYGSPSAPPRKRLPWRRSRRVGRWSRSSTTSRCSCRSGCGYYSRFFAPEDIYVLDNDTSDGSTDRDGFVRIPVATRSRRPRLDGARRSRLPARAARALRRRPGHRRRRDRRPRPGVGHARRLHRPLRRGVRQLPRLRDPAPAGPRAAARPRPAGPRPARLLVRQRRLRQAGARHGADDVGARASTPAPTGAATSIPTCA